MKKPIKKLPTHVLDVKGNKIRPTIVKWFTRVLVSNKKSQVETRVP